MANTNPDFTQLSLGEHPHCSYDEWKEKLEAKTGKGFDALYEPTMEKIPVAPFYTKDVYDDCNHLDFMSGIPPFLRGPYSTMYVSAHGPFVSTQASPRQKNPTHSIRETWQQVRRVCPLHSTFRPTAATMRITRALSAT